MSLLFRLGFGVGCEGGLAGRGEEARQDRKTRLGIGPGRGECKTKLGGKGARIMGMGFKASKVKSG